MIDFAIATFVPYGGSGQNPVGEATASPDGTTVTLVGNNWQAFPYAVTIQPDTVLEFDFSSTAQGEVHGIGLDTQTGWSNPLDRVFQLYGTQTWGIQDYRTYTAGVTHYSIPIGTFFTGDFTYLVFANDHDVPNPNAVSEFSNVEFVIPGGREAELEAVLVEIRDLAVEAVGA